MFSSKPLTVKQKEIFNYLKEIKEEGKVAPTYREITNHFGFKSTKSAMDHITALEKKGYIRRNIRKSRGIELLSDNETSESIVSAPIIGNIAAGYPEMKFETSQGSISVDQKLLGARNIRKLFALQVRGESMIGRGIHDGDWIIADAAVSPIEGNVVVAMIDGESTLKTLARKNKKLFLKAENPNFNDLVPVEEMMIQGVVRVVLRQMF